MAVVIVPEVEGVAVRRCYEKVPVLDMSGRGGCWRGCARRNGEVRMGTVARGHGSKYENKDMAG